jgi:hypothetical protein
VRLAIVLLAVAIPSACSKDEDNSLWMVRAEVESVQGRTGCEDLPGVTEAMWQSTSHGATPTLAFAKVTGLENAERVGDCLAEKPWASNVSVTRREDSPSSTFSRSDD